jgi:hypothetical protein
MKEWGTTWRSRSGMTETSDVKRKDEDVLENAGAVRIPTSVVMV